MPTKDIKITTLGAARANGKSCILVNILGRLIMLDCGIDPSFDSSNNRYLPNFSKIGDLSKLSSVIITHCHADHIGALPYLTEVLGYDGPVYMTEATRHMAEVVLEESIKQSDSSKISLVDVVNCLSKVKTMSINQSWNLPYDSSITISFYSAGHVLGAAMVLLTGAEVGVERSVLYTGDFNHVDDGIYGKRCIPDFYPGILKQELDVLITETTFCNTIRESRIEGQKELISEIHRCLKGYHDNSNLTLLELLQYNQQQSKRILIPLSISSGRLQEYLILLDEYLTSISLDIKLYYFSPLAKRYNHIIKQFPLYSTKYNNNLNSFDFDKLTHVEYWPFSFNNSEEQFKNLSTDFIFMAPDSNLSHGLSKSLFKIIADREDCSIIFPGRCPNGTLGFQVINSGNKQEKKVIVDNQEIQLKCNVKVLDTFSNHTDAKGILDLISLLKPKNIILVHGEEENMLNFSRIISKLELGNNIFCPKLNETKSCKCD